MATFHSKSGKADGKFRSESFVWTDDEVELLLKVTLEYKVAKTSESVDWESCYSKYSDILERFLDQYPTLEQASEMGKDYPHRKEEITKSNVTTKMKAIRQKFRMAVDSGRKSGHGRVVLLYFDSCEEIWGGSPATSSISSGIETSEILPDAHIDSPGSPESSSSVADNEISTFDTPPSVLDRTTKESSSKERRNLLDLQLRTYKKEKLKRKLPLDSQLLTIAHEELEIKKKLLNKMDTMDTEYSNHMGKLTSSMDKLAGSIAEGFTMIRQLMLQSSAMHTHYVSPQQSSYQGMFDRVPRPINSDSNNRQYSYSQALFPDEHSNY